MTAAPRPDGALLQVRVTPRASRSGLDGWHGPTLKVRVTAGPAEGRANRAVAELLARACGVPVSAVELVRGGASRDKLFRVGDLSAEAVRARLSEAGR